MVGVLGFEVSGLIVCSGVEKEEDGGVCFLDAWMFEWRV